MTDTHINGSQQTSSPLSLLIQFVKLVPGCPGMPLAAGGGKMEWKQQGEESAWEKEEKAWGTLVGKAGAIKKSLTERHGKMRKQAHKGIQQERQMGAETDSAAGGH